MKQIKDYKNYFIEYVYPSPFISTVLYDDDDNNNNNNNSNNDNNDNNDNNNTNG